MASKYRCLSPRYILNKNNDRIQVSCGICDACLTQKASNLSKMCIIESTLHKYCYFVTLDYSPEYVPIAHFECEKMIWRLVNDTPRLSYLYENDIIHDNIEDSVFKGFDFDALMNHYYDPRHREPDPCSYTKYHINYFCKQDAQGFLKRFRRNFQFLYKRLTKKTDFNEKIRYFYCGEYGPVHFRPHLHFLLFFDSDFIAKNLSEVLRTSWKFGNSDYSASRGGCASYVAGYINSFVGTPSILRTKYIRPRSYHSRYFAYKPYEILVEKMQESSDFRPLTCSFSQNGKLSPLLAPISFQYHLFPRCHHYSKATDYDKYCLYELYPRAVRLYGDLPVSLLASFMFHDVKERERLQGICGDELLEISVVTMLYCSKRYQKLEEKYGIGFRKRLDKYYDALALYNLKSSLRRQREFIVENGIDHKDKLRYFYDNIPDMNVNKYKLSSRYRERYEADLHLFYNFCDQIGILPFFVERGDIHFRDDPDYQNRLIKAYVIRSSKIKHKELNDRNKQFL